MADGTMVIGALGWALLDFLWQGLLVGALAALALHVRVPENFDAPLYARARKEALARTGRGAASSDQATDWWPTR